MRVIFSKAGGAGGAAAVLTCIRDDGTITFSKSAHGGVFGPHDLMHYAVETTLRLRDSFFGLIERGWAIGQFAEPGAAARLPPEAKHTEMMVGQLLQEQAYGPPLAAAAFNGVIAASLAAVRGTAPAARRLTDDELRRIRERFAELLGRLRALRAGEKLELPFPGDAA